MTSIAYRIPHLHGSLTQQVFVALSSVRIRIRHAWKRHSDERLIESLPFETMKDIGFRSGSDGNAAR